MGLSVWLMLITLSILWGGSFFFVGVVVGALPTLLIVLLRVGLAAMTLWIVILFSANKNSFSLSVLFAFLGMGLLNNVIPFSAIVWGQSYISSGLASILNATTPIFTVLIAHVFLSDEKISLAKFIGVLLGFAGVAVMLYPSLQNDSTYTIYGQLAILVAALSYGFAAVFGRRFRSLGVSPIFTAAGQLSASTLILLPVALITIEWQKLQTPSLSIVLAIVALAVACTALAYLLFFRILASAGANSVSLVTLLIPASAVLLGIVFLDEELTRWQLLGMLIIALGLLIMDGRLYGHLKALKR